MRSWIGACLCIITLFAEGKAQIILDSGPNRYLKGIEAIRYDTNFENQMTGPRCAIRKDNWAIAVDFVANQSTKLKLIHEGLLGTPTPRYDELLRIRDSLLASWIANPKDQGLTKKYEDAQKEFSDYVLMPRLEMTVTAFELQSGCAGTVKGKLEVDVTPTSIKVTKAEVSHPTVVIWNYDHAIKGPHESFSGFMISSGEQLIKKLVNAWTEAQKAY